MISLWDVLKASKGLPVSDFYAAMWGKQITVKYTIAELEGALPLTFNANGEALIDYRIYGNTEQTGTPTPENPIMPIGCGERTENLLDSNFEQGYYIVTSGVPSDSSRYIRSDKQLVSSGETYTFSFNSSKIGITGSGPDVWVMFWDTNNHYLGYRQEPQYMDHTTFVTPENTGYVALMVGAGMNNEMTPTDISEVMLNLGSTALPYEPYGYKLPILSNSTVTNIYLGEVQTTRRIKKLVLTGEEAWIIFTTSYYIKVTNYYRGYDVGHHLSVCSHYPNAQMTTLPEMHYGLGGLIDGQSYTRWNGNIVFNPSPTISSLTDWKSFLAAQYSAGTPVTVWYVLDEPETAVVNEPLMKIEDYADTVSMEQAGVSIPTNNGSTVIDYDGTPKPEQMYIKYLEVKND